MSAKWSLAVKATEKLPAQFLEDLSPAKKRTFNFAALINTSKTLQELVKLQVSLFDIENVHPKAAKTLTSLDFERDCAGHIKFLVDNGVKAKNLGRFITEYPMIFQEPLDDLQTRLNYLQHKGFSQKMISMALNNSSHAISHKVKTTDFKLGQLQVDFRLAGQSVREIFVRHPPVVAIPVMRNTLTKFALGEEFGFSRGEIEKMLVKNPKILELFRQDIIRRLDLLHNQIGLSHGCITSNPGLITGPMIDIKYRSQYLNKLKRDQYDETKPLYVPPSALYKCSDEEFCARYSKTDLEDYKLFIKSI